MGRSFSPKESVRPALAVALFALISTGIPQPTVASVTPPAATVAAANARAATLGTRDLLDPTTLVQRYEDAEAKVAITPPAEWRLSPATSLDRAADDELYEVARFQLRLGDAALYAQPLPVTSGLLADAGAVLSIALAREGSDLLDVDLSAIDPEALEKVPGATAVDGEASYEGVVTFTRTLVARGTGRVAVIRAFVPAADRDALAPVVLAAIATARIEAGGPNGPAYVPPAPPPAPEPAPASAAQGAPAAAVPEPASGARAQIISRARAMLGTPYVWGGNVAGRGMDCSAYVSATWGVARYTTDSIRNVAVAITKDQLLPGDAMNLETFRDPTRAGHIRIFDAWANAARTLVWVYEETPPRAIHRVIAYDPAYRPIRLAWLAGGGVAPLVPAPAAQPAPRLTAAPVATRRPSATKRPSATPRPTAKPTAKATARPTATPRATATARPATTPRPTTTARAATTPRPSPVPTVRAATATAAPPAKGGQATAKPRPTSAPKGR